MTLNNFTSSLIYLLKLQTYNYKLTWMTNADLKFNMSRLLIICLKPTFPAVFLISVNANFILPVVQAKSLRGIRDSLLTFISTSSPSAVHVGSLFKLQPESDCVFPLPLLTLKFNAKSSFAWIIAITS